MKTKRIVCKKAAGRSAGSFFKGDSIDKSHPAYNIQAPDRDPDLSTDLYDFFFEEQIVLVVHRACRLSFCPVTNRAMFMAPTSPPVWTLMDEKISRKITDMIVEKTVLK